MEKLLKMIEQMKADKLALQKEHELYLKQIREESNVTIKGLREANERLFED